MPKEFTIEIDDAYGVYSFIDNYEELLDDVNFACGKDEVDKVKEWAENANVGDSYKSNDGIIFIYRED